MQGLGSCSEADRRELANRHTARLSVALRKLGTLPVKMASDFVTALAESPLPAECRTSLQSVIASLASEDCEDGKQNFESIAQMLPASFVANFNEPGFANRLFDLLVKLGFRKGSERSFREFTVLCMLASDGVEKSLLHSYETKKAMLQSTNKWFKARLEKLPPPVTSIHVLPDTVEALERMDRDLAQAIYGADPQTPLPINPLAVENLRCGTRCRKFREHAPDVGNNLAPTVAMIGNLIRTELRNAGPMPIQYFRPEHQDQGQDQAYGPYVGAGCPRPLGRPAILGGRYEVAAPPLQNLGPHSPIAGLPLQGEGSHQKVPPSPVADMLQAEGKAKQVSIKESLNMVEKAVFDKKDPPEGHFVQWDCFLLRSFRLPPHLSTPIRGKTCVDGLPVCR